MREMICTRSLRRSLALLPLALILLTAGTALAQDRKFEYPIRTQAFDMDGQPVPRVPVILDGKVVGYTDKDGKFEGVLTEGKGAEINLSLGPIEGFAYIKKAEVKKALAINPDINGNAVGEAIELKAQLKRTQVDIVVWVHAKCGENLYHYECKNLPVLLDGKEIARTDAFGRAHVKIGAESRSEHKISIDTPDYNKEAPDAFLMVPRDPEYTFKVTGEPGVFLVDELFISAVKRKKKRTTVRRTTKPRVRTRTRPRTATKTRPKTKPRTNTRGKTKPKGKEVIDLFN